MTNPFRAPISTILAILLAAGSHRLPLAAQDAPPSKLNLVIVEGEGAINNIRQRVAREPIVQVEDENRKPLAGVAVVFAVPGQGPGGTFANGANELTVLTDNQGRAVMRGFRANNQQGNYAVRVTASFRGLTATTNINMSNAALAATGAGIGAAKLGLILAAVGGAAAAGIAVGVTRNGGTAPATPTGPPTPPPTVLTPGTPTVGPPR